MPCFELIIYQVGVNRWWKFETFVRDRLTIDKTCLGLERRQATDQNN